MRSPSTEIIRTLSHLEHTERPWRIFTDWVEACYHGLRMLPKHAESVLSGGGLVDDDEEGKSCFQRIDERYGREGYEVIRQAYWQMLTAADEEPYYDPFGTVYEEWELGNDRTGQFFTPQPMCRMMAQVTAEDAADRVRKRIREAFSSSPSIRLAEIIGLELGDHHLRPVVIDSIRKGEQPEYEPVKVYDPACGSGRLLLAVAEQVPQWMVHHGLILFYGQDVDRDCVLMAKANTMLYGMNGHAHYLKREGGSVEEIPEELPASEEEGGQLILL